MRTCISLLLVLPAIADPKSPLPEVSPILVISEDGAWSDPEVTATPKLALYSDGVVIVRPGSDRHRHRYLTGKLSASDSDAISATIIQFLKSRSFDGFYRQSDASDQLTTAIAFYAGPSRVVTAIYGAGLFSVIRTTNGIDFDSAATGLPTDLCRLLLLLTFATQQCTEEWIPASYDPRGFPIFPHGVAIEGPHVSFMTKYAPPVRNSPDFEYWRREVFGLPKEKTKSLKP